MSDKAFYGAVGYVFLAVCLVSLLALIGVGSERPLVFLGALLVLIFHGSGKLAFEAIDRSAKR